MRDGEYMKNIEKIRDGRVRDRGRVEDIIVLRDTRKIEDKQKLRDCEMVENTRSVRCGEITFSYLSLHML